MRAHELYAPGVWRYLCACVEHAPATEEIRATVWAAARATTREDAQKAAQTVIVAAAAAVAHRAALASGLPDILDREVVRSSAFHAEVAWQRAAMEQRGLHLPMPWVWA